MPQFNSIPFHSSMMELQISYSILFTSLSFLLLFLHILNKSNSKNCRKNLPPGPWKLPLVGNLHQLIGSLPHHSLKNLADKYGPIIHLQLGETSTVVISSAELVKEIMKTHDAVFANRPSLLAGKILMYGEADLGFTPYGSRFVKLRKILNLELLSAKRVHSFSFIREEEVSAMIKTILAAEGTVVNLTDMLFKLTNDITARAAFGRKCRDQGEFLKLSDEALNLLAGLSVSDLYPSIKVLPVITGMRAKLERVHRDLDKILENIIKDHRENSSCHHGEGEEDFVEALLKLQHQNEMEISLSYNNIKALILDIFIAGTDTSSTTMDWTMAELLRNPKAMTKVQAEVRRVFDGKGYVDETEIHQLKFLKSVIKEVLRLHPPGPLLIPRESKEICVIKGYEIPAKTRLIINAWAMGRDPKYWEEAENFKPERFLDSPIEYNFKGTNFEYIPFGAGRRMCPGMTFAIPNIELPLASLLYHFDWKLPNGMKHGNLEMTEDFGSSAFRKVDLCLIPVGYKP